MRRQKARVSPVRRGAGGENTRANFARHGETRCIHSARCGEASGCVHFHSIGSRQQQGHRKTGTNCDGREAIETVGFTPHGGARGPRIGRTHILALMVQDITIPFVVEALPGVEDLIAILAWRYPCCLLKCSCEILADPESWREGNLSYRQTILAQHHFCVLHSEPSSRFDGRPSYFGEKSLVK